MSADSWRAYNKGVPIPEAWRRAYEVAVPPVNAKKTVDEILSEAFDRLAEMYPVRPEMPVHQATADQKPFYPIVQERPGFIGIIDRPQSEINAAKNFRRAAARRRHRLARRLGKSVSELSCEDMRKAGFKLRHTREDGDPTTGASESAAATPAPAPARGRLTAGEPGPDEHPEVTWINAVLRAADEAAGRVPLSTKSEPRERPFVPNKWGEHGDD